MDYKRKKYNIDVGIDRNNPVYWIGAFDFGDIKLWLPDDYKGRVGILIKLKLKIQRFYEKAKRKR